MAASPFPYAAWIDWLDAQRRQARRDSADDRLWEALDHARHYGWLAGYVSAVADHSIGDYDFGLANARSLAVALNFDPSAFQAFVTRLVEAHRATLQGDCCATR